MLISHSRRASTKKQYEPYIKRWEEYCRSRKIDTLSATIDDGINFLASLCQSGLKYNAINTARRALSSILIFSDYSTFGKHPLVKRLLSVRIKTSLSKYTSTWNVTIVLEYLANLGLHETLNLKELTLKLVMLMILLITIKEPQ